FSGGGRERRITPGPLNVRRLAREISDGLRRAAQAAVVSLRAARTNRGAEMARTTADPADRTWCCYRSGNVRPRVWWTLGNQKPQYRTSQACACRTGSG